MSHSKMLTARRSKQKAKKQLTRLAKQAKKQRNQKTKTPVSSGQSLTS